MKKQKGLTQKEQILNHLLSGQSITPLEAYFEYGTLSLQYHIWCLRAEGFDIETEMCTSVNGKRYAKYTLKGYNSSNEIKLLPKLSPVVS